MTPAHRIACLFNLALACALAVGPAAAQNGAPTAKDGLGNAGPLTADAAHNKLMQEGVALQEAGQSQRTIDEYFDKIIAEDDRRFAELGKTVYAARTPAEALRYLRKYAADPNQKTDAVVVASVAAYAHFMKAYALVDLKRDLEARLELDLALALSPDNSQFLDELGSWYLRHRNWDDALASYRHAEDVIALVPPELKNVDLAVAWRGIGYVYVEQHKLDEAETMYRKCLELDPKDQKARNELEYIRQQRAKAG